MSATDPFQPLFNLGLVDPESPSADLDVHQCASRGPRHSASLRPLGGPRALIRLALARIRVVFLLLPMLLLAVPNHCVAQEVAAASPPEPLALTAAERAYLAQLAKLTICTFPDWMPYEQITASGAYRGIGADLTALLAEQLGVPVVLLPTRSWSESLINVRDGRCDLLPMTMDVPSRRAYLDYSAPFTAQPFVIATRRSYPFVANLAELDDASVAVVEGFAAGELIAERYPQLEIVTVANVTEGLELVRHGRVEGYIDSLATIAYQLQREESIDIKVAGALGFDLQLSNRRKLDEVLSRSVELSRRNARPLALIMLDLDHFKLTNDNYGHQVGDQILRQVAALIREQCRTTDLPGRWGGEEFLIVCPETERGAALVLAERLRARIAGHQFDQVQHQTISLGLADFIAGDTPDSLLARADAALYAAKRLGRNRVEIGGKLDESAVMATAPGALPGLERSRG